MTTLYIFSGLPATGKSTLAARLSKYLGASYLRVDTIVQSLKELYGKGVSVEGYILAYRLAADNLKQGLNVIGDSCNSVLESRVEWQQAAIDAGAQYINIEVCCSNREQHRARVEDRNSPVTNLVLPSWESVNAREFHPWGSDVVSIDTANESPEQSFKNLIKLLGV
ncbi:MAG: AAA family ATPase [Colwellia sp.]|nr:AAA family ATPase [Colwellia sp.]